MQEQHLAIEWMMLDEERVALVFDRETWRAYEAVAAERDSCAQDMIAKAVVRLLGLVVFDGQQSRVYSR